MALFNRGLARREERKICHSEAVQARVKEMARRMQFDVLAGLEQLAAEEADFTAELIKLEIAAENAANDEEYRVFGDICEDDSWLDYMDEAIDHISYEFAYRKVYNQDFNTAYEKRELEALRADYQKEFDYDLALEQMWAEDTTNALADLEGLTLREVMDCDAWELQASRMEVN